MPTLFLKLTTEKRQIRRFQRPTHVWRRPSKKRLRNDSYCQELELLTYILAADNVGLRSLVFM